MMKVEYTVTLADYKSALALHNRQKVFGRANNYFMLRIVPAFAAISSLGSGWWERAS